MMHLTKRLEHVICSVGSNMQHKGSFTNSAVCGLEPNCSIDAQHDSYAACMTEYNINSGKCDVSSHLGIEAFPIPRP